MNWKVGLDSKTNSGNDGGDGKYLGLLPEATDFDLTVGVTRHAVIHRGKVFGSMHMHKHHLLGCSIHISCWQMRYRNLWAYVRFPATFQ